MYVSMGNLSIQGTATAALNPFSDIKLLNTFHSRASLTVPHTVAEELLKTHAPRCAHVSCSHEEVGFYNRFKQI